MANEQAGPAEATAGFDRDGTGVGVVLRPDELTALVRANLIAPVGDGQFRLNVDAPVDGQPATVSASLIGNGAGVTLSGNEEGLRRIEAVLGNLRYSRESAGRGLITQAMELSGDQGFVRGQVSGDYRRADAGLNIPAKNPDGWGTSISGGLDNQGDRSFNIRFNRSF